jgi:uncharacterized membrane protein YphA (DoxX/SURF4 family)
VRRCSSISVSRGRRARALLLAGLFIIAGISKLADLHGSRQAMRNFGVPSLLATPLGTLLPVAELAVGIALLLAYTAWLGAMGALALLLLFVIGIGYNLARGRKPDCHCFGQLQSAPAGWSTLIRNLLLAAVAGLVIGLRPRYADPNVFGWFATLPVTQRIELPIALFVLIVLFTESWMLWQVLHQQGVSCCGWKPWKSKSLLPYLSRRQIQHRQLDYQWGPWLLH